MLQDLTPDERRFRANLIHSANTSSLVRRLSRSHTDPGNHLARNHILLTDTKDLWTETHRSYHHRQ